MKNIRKIAILMFFITSIFANNGENLNNFAYGYEIVLSENKNNAVSKIVVPIDIYLNAYSKNLDDVRIFNNKGELVSYAFSNNMLENIEHKSVKTVLFKIKDNEDRVAKEIEKGDTHLSEYTYTYLLKFPQDFNHTNDVNSVKFKWEKTNYNWEANVDVAFSENSNLKNNQIVKNAPIMQLKDVNNENVFILDTINISRYYRGAQATNGNDIIITIRSTVKLPDMQYASVGFQDYNADKDVENFHMNYIKNANQSLIYKLKTSQPAVEIKMSLNDANSVMPVEIYYKSDKEQDDWVKLEDKVLTSINYEENKIILKNPLLIEQIMIKPINTSYNNVPTVYISRKRSEIIFNSANNGPFILAYGSNIAKKVAISPNVFKDQHVSYAGIGKHIKFAGEKAFMQKEDNANNSQISKWLIWITLGLGVVFLVALSLRLIKEIKKEI